MSGSSLAVKVLRKAVEAQDICSLELAAADGRALPPFAAGSHIDVQLPGGLTRQYSLCNDPTETHRYLIAVLRDPVSRGGSAAVHEQVHEGDTLQISAPRNHFALAHEADSHLLLAGGIGVTPLLCMAERLARAGQAFEMHYCTRSASRTAFLQRIQAAAYAPLVQFHHDDGPAAQRLDLAALLAQPVAGRHLYVCGPKGYMDVVLSTARAQGWPEPQIHFEFFGAEVVPAAGDSSFEVMLASSGRVIPVASDRSVVAALSEAGISLPTSCEQGVCGTCLTRVIEGTPDHRDLYLTPEEQAANDQFLPCCSRARSARLVLDL